jgi:hypothetical protein
MSLSRIKWLLRVCLPVAGFVLALWCGKSVLGALGMVALTALIVALSLVDFSPVGILFVSLAAVYTTCAENELRHPDTPLFLPLNILAALVLTGLLSWWL